MFIQLSPCCSYVLPDTIWNLSLAELFPQETLKAPSLFSMAGTTVMEAMVVSPSVAYTNPVTWTTYSGDQQLV